VFHPLIACGRSWPGHTPTGTHPRVWRRHHRQWFGQQRRSARPRDRLRVRGLLSGRYLRTGGWPTRRSRCSSRHWPTRGRGSGTT